MISAKHPVWAMAFRPLYLAASCYGALSVLLWGFGYQGTAALAGKLWHAHEMIWGYAGLVIVAFLLTAVATWTQRAPVSGYRLMLLAALWLTARTAVFFPQTILLSGIAGTFFYLSAACLMGHSVVAARNRRNYIAVAALTVFGLSHFSFHISLHTVSGNLLNGLHAGLLLVAGFIGFIGTRIIPFFTARRLNTPQAASPAWAALAPLLLPLAAAVCTVFDILPAAAAVCCGAAGVLALVQSLRWHEKGIWREPLLWVLHLGYVFTAAGLMIDALSRFLPLWYSVGIHLIAVGGIGLLTVGMMARTALGHTGRSLYPLPPPMTLSFILMAAAAFVRTFAAVHMYDGLTAYRYGVSLSAVLFAASLLLFFIRYLPWLITPRSDGQPG